MSPAWGKIEFGEFKADPVRRELIDCRSLWPYDWKPKDDNHPLYPDGL